MNTLMTISLINTNVNSFLLLPFYVQSDGDASEKSSESSDSDDDKWSTSSSSDGEKGKAVAAAIADRGDEVDKHARALDKYGKREGQGKEALSKAKGKDKKKDRPAKTKQPKLLFPEPAYHPPGSSKSKEASIFQPGEKIDADLVSKKLQEVTALRGRKGFDRSEQIRNLYELAEAAATVGLKSVLEVRASLIRAYFDANFGRYKDLPNI